MTAIHTRGGTHSGAQPIEVRLGGTAVGTRRFLNFVEGASIGLTVADDSTNEDVDVTVAWSKALAALANGGVMTFVVNEELITLDTGGPTTDSTADLLPANALILGVCARVTTTITGVTAAVSGWRLGDTTTSNRFSQTNTTLTAGTTTVGLEHLKGGVSTDATGPTQTAAAKLRVTMTGGADNIPTAGAIRVHVYALVFTAPTS